MKYLKSLKGAKMLSKMEQKAVKGGLIPCFNGRCLIGYTCINGYCFEDEHQP